MSLDPSAGLPGPLALKALIAGVFLTSGVQAWQFLDDRDAPSSGLPQTIYVAAAETEDEPVGPPVPGPVAEETAPQPPPPEPPTPPTPPPTQPKEVTLEEGPRYREFLDYTLVFHVSSTPLTPTPWTGNGPPHIIAYYDGINDTAMLHTAFLSRWGGEGFDVCANPIISFDDFVGAYVPAASERLVYASVPLPNNAYDLLGTGENCYTRVYATSEWRAQICVEGDGEIAEAWDETLADGTLVHHLDIFDSCWTAFVEF